MTVFLTFGNTCSTSSASLNIRQSAQGSLCILKLRVHNYDRFLIFVLIMKQKNVNNVNKYVYCILNMMCNGVG